MSREKRYLFREWLKRANCRFQISSDIKKIKNSDQEECLTLSSYKYFYDSIRVTIGDDDVVLAYPISLALPAPQIYVFPEDRSITRDVILHKEPVMISIKTGAIRRRSNNHLLNIDYLKFIKRLSEVPIRADGATGLEILSEMIVQNEATFELLNVLRYKQAKKIAVTTRNHLEKWFQEEAYF